MAVLVTLSPRSIERNTLSGERLVADIIINKIIWQYASSIILRPICRWRKGSTRARLFLAISVTRLDDFWKFLVTHFQTKVAQHFEKPLLLSCKNCCGYFWKPLGYFLSQHLVTLLATLIFHLLSWFNRLKITEDDGNIVRAVTSEGWPDNQIVFSIFGHFEKWKFAQKLLYKLYQSELKNFAQNKINLKYIARDF